MKVLKIAAIVLISLLALATVLVNIDTRLQGVRYSVTHRPYWPAALEHHAMASYNARRNWKRPAPQWEMVKYGRTFRIGHWEINRYNPAILDK